MKHVSEEHISPVRARGIFELTRSDCPRHESTCPLVNKSIWFLKYWGHVSGRHIPVTTPRRIFPSS